MRLSREAARALSDRVNWSRMTAWIDDKWSAFAASPSPPGAPVNRGSTPAEWSTDGVAHGGETPEWATPKTPRIEVPPVEVSTYLHPPIASDLAAAGHAASGFFAALLIGGKKLLVMLFAAPFAALCSAFRKRSVGHDGAPADVASGRVPAAGSRGD